MLCKYGGKISYNCDSGKIAVYKIGIVYMQQTPWSYVGNN